MIGDRTRQPGSARVTASELAVQGAVLLVILAVFFPGVFLRGEMALPGDLLHDLAPWRDYVETSHGVGGNYASIEALSLFHKFYVLSKASLDAGEWPLWNRLENAGMPLLANYQSAVCYPPRLLHAFLPIPLATTLYVLLKLWLCGFNAYLLGRGLELRTSAVRFLSIAWMASGFCTVWAYWTPTDVAAWFPLAFLGTEWLLLGRYRRGTAALFVSAPLLTLAGQPQVAFVFALGLGIYVLLRGSTDARARNHFPRTMLYFGIAWGFAVLASMCQILPFLQYLSNAADVSTRMGMGIEEFTYFLSSVVALWVSRFFGTDIDGNYWYDVLNPTYVGMLYAGVVVWLCLPYAFISANGQDAPRKRAIPLAVSGALLGVLAWRPPALGFVFDLSILASVRPAYFTTFAVFALPILAALGVNNWSSGLPRFRRLIPSLIMLGLMCLIVGSFYAFQYQTLALEGLKTYVLNRVILAAVIAALTLVGLALPLCGSSRRFPAHILPLLVFVDLLLASTGFHHTSASDEVLPKTALTDYLANLEKPSRVSVVTGGISLGLFPCYGIETWGGYDALYPERIVELREILDDQMMVSFEATCAISHYLYVSGAPPYPPQGDPACLNKVATLDGIDVYENLCALPRAYLAARTLDVPDKEARFSVLSSSGFNPRYTAVVEAPLPGPAPSAELADLGPAEVLERTATHVRIQASSEADCVLVLADAYYPGWKATVDGEPIEVFPVNHAFRGVLMPAGAHRIEFRYAPESFSVGLTISVCALLVSSGVALCILWRISQRKRRHG